MQHAVYAQPGRCLEDCACAGVYEASECPMEPGCDRCYLRLHAVGAAPPDRIRVIRVLPGEPLRRVVERELGPDYARGVGAKGWVN